MYSTTDYKRFDRKRGNRAINTLKVKKIVREIRHGNDLLCDFPILVASAGSKLQVIDGQHRLEAAVSTKKPVYYIIRKNDMQLHELAKANSLQEKWKARDYIECYIEQGNEHYRKLESFMTAYDVPVSVALNLLYNGVARDGGASRNVKDLFTRGEFVVKHYRQAVDVMESCRRFERFDGWNSAGFITAITRVLQGDQCDFDLLVQKFERSPAALEHQGSVKAYLTNLENIYNIGNRQRRVIY